jgi:hypothetical protein
MSEIQKINAESVRQFKRDVVGACPSLVTLKQQNVARGIPDELFEVVFKEVFNADSSLARDVMYNRFDRIDEVTPEAEIESIFTLLPAAEMLANTMASGGPVLLISDVDNDGELAQALGMEFKAITGHNISVESRDYNPATHGFSIDQINKWLVEQDMKYNEDFVVIVADLGTNQRDVQEKFIELFPNGKLIVADHHKPQIDMVMHAKAERSFLVSPFVKGSFFTLGLLDGGGVSGGFLTYSILKNTLLKLKQKDILQLTDEQLIEKVKPLRAMGKAANLLDRVRCDIRLKPLHQKELNKVLDVSSNASKGQAIGKWVEPAQAELIQNLTDLVSTPGINALNAIRQRFTDQNHIARALYETLPLIIGNDRTKTTVPFEVARLLSTNDPVKSGDKNYVELLKPYVFHFNYENQFDGDAKSTWLSLSDNVFRAVGDIEKDLLERIREYQLVSEISDDFVALTQAASPSVSKAFTSRQLSKAYHSATKPINLSVTLQRREQVIIGYRSSMDMPEILAQLKNVLPGIKVDMIGGHSKVGALSVSIPPNMDANNVLTLFVKTMNDEAKVIQDATPPPPGLMVKPIHLPLIREMFQTMRIHLNEASAPLLLMQVQPNMTFEDKYTLEKLPVAHLAQEREWHSTVEPLDFSNSSSLIIPNQALRTIANDNYEGAMGISLMAKGSFVVNSVVTGAQLKRGDYPALVTPLQREQAAMGVEYKKRFANSEVPLVNVPRAAAIQALKFTSDSQAVFENSESLILGVLDRTGADSYVVIDVEADGAGNAECINVGMSVFKLSPASGELITDFYSLYEQNEGFKNIKNITRSGQNDAIINRELTVALSSQIISRDGSKPIRIAIKTQNLTNMDQDFIDLMGVSAEEAQARLLPILEGAGNFVIQAHNLPYDNNIIRVNFPEMYALMQNAIHLDSAPLSKNEQIAYMNLRVNTLGGKEFFNAEHQGYNLSTLLRTEDNFNYPSIKGDVVLQVRGDEFSIIDLSTRLSTHLDIEREGLADTLMLDISSMRHPQYGIEKLLRMASIHDMILHQPIKETNPVNYNGFGLPELPEGLWMHFQDNYAYDMTVSQNIARFSVIPEVLEYCQENISVNIKDPQFGELIAARNIGAGDKFDATKSFKKQADADAHAEMLSSFKGQDVLKSNITSFLKSNPDNAERFARSWVYELVLEHHETTRKDMPRSFITGVSEMTGVSEDMVSTIYEEMYVYKKSRGIQSYRVEETHNNVGLEGDAYQEVHVFLHMLSARLRNPYTQQNPGIKQHIDPLSPVVDSLCQQAAESTMKQVIREVNTKLLNDDVINNYSARQLDNFDDDGISIAGDRQGIAKMKCRTLSDSQTSVHIELPTYDAERFRAMTDVERKEIENQVELAVTTIILANSTQSKSLAVIPKSIEQLKLLQSYIGVMSYEGVFDKVASDMDDAVEIMKTVKALGKILPVPHIDGEKLTIPSLAKTKLDPNAIAHYLSNLTTYDDLTDKIEELDFAMTARDMVISVVTNPEMIDNLKAVKEYFGTLNPTRRESQIKKIMKQVADAVLGKDVLKLSVNKELSPSDLNSMKESVVGGVKRLKEQQGFESFLDVDDLGVVFRNAEMEFEAFEHLRKTGEILKDVPGFDGDKLSRGANSELSKAVTHSENVLQVLLDANPDLAQGINNTKTDPLNFMLMSPLVSKVINCIEYKEPDITVDMALEINKPGDEDLSAKIKR